MKRLDRTQGSPTSILLVALLCAGALSLQTGCAKHYVTDEDVPEIDSYTRSLRLDRKDIHRLYDENIDKILSSSIAKIWERQAARGEAPAVAIFPMRNETSEHIDDALDTLLSDFETDLVQKTPVDVISHERQPQLIAEVKRQQSAAYDPTRLARFGRQVGAQYFVTGKVMSTSDRGRGEKRVQYSMFVQIIETETAIVKFQNKSELTKGLVR
jgi:hypothetical protein